MFDNDVDVDVTEAADDMDERAPQSISPAGSSYEPTGATSNKKSARSSMGESSSRKRNKKKANVVYTDEEDEESEDGEVDELDDGLDEESPLTSLSSTPVVHPKDGDTADHKIEPLLLS